MNQSAGSRPFMVCAVTILAATMIGSAQAGPISVALVTVGDPGNAADSTGFGAVNYAYQIGKYDVTTSQYAAFLNAVAATDPYGLYSPQMASVTLYAPCGIVQNGVSGSFTYSVTPGHENFPVNYVSWGSAARFVNWLQNGQPTGSEGPGTTETGAYALNGAITQAALGAVTRNSGATWFLPTEDEWYKAAYYKGGGLSAGYWLYPTQSNSAPSNVLSATGTNNANFFNGGFTDPTNYLTPVGASRIRPAPMARSIKGAIYFNGMKRLRLTRLWTATRPAVRSYLQSIPTWILPPTSKSRSRCNAMTSVSAWLVSLSQAASFYLSPESSR